MSDCRLTQTLDGWYCLTCSRLFPRVPERCPEPKTSASLSPHPAILATDSVSNCEIVGNAPTPAEPVTYGKTSIEPAPLQAATPEVSYGDPFPVFGELTPELRIKLRSLPALKRAYERRTGLMLGRTRRHSIQSITYGKPVWVAVVRNPSHGLHYFRLVWGDGADRLGYRDIPGGNTGSELAQARAAAVQRWIAGRLELEEILRRCDRGDW